MPENEELLFEDLAKEHMGTLLCQRLDWREIQKKQIIWCSRLTRPLITFSSGLIITVILMNG